MVADVHKRAALSDWLNLQLRPMFENRVLPVSEDVMFKWRLMVEAGRKAGHTFSQPDLIVAATALHHGLTIVSRDTGGYDRTGVPLVNPWKDWFFEKEIGMSSKNVFTIKATKYQLA